MATRITIGVECSSYKRQPRLATVVLLWRGRVLGMTSVLIVDDSSAVRRSLVRLFADGGFEVCGEAGNGREAIERAPGLSPDLIVMDLSMPTMNGIEAARCLSQAMPAVLIILLSDYGGMFPDEDARSAGIAAIVSKTECASVLLHAARTLLHETRA
jgi:two-component system chemotaxis response regulator CheY